MMDKNSKHIVKFCKSVGKMKGLIKLMAAFAVFAMQSTLNAQNLVQNAAFDGVSPYQVNGTSVKGLVSDYPVSDWTIPAYALVFTPGTTQNDHGVSMIDTTLSGAIPGGGNMLAVDGDVGDGIVQQTITGLTVGTAYNLSFYQGMFQQKGYTGLDTANFNVSVGSDLTATTPTNTVANDGTGGAPVYGPWQLQNFTFTASVNTEMLQFVAVGTGQPPFMTLSGVTLAPVTVPEPGGAILLLVVGTLLIIRRRRLAAA